MKKRVLALTFGAVLAGQMAFAITPDEIISDLQAEGYTRVEVRVGPNQIKVEAIRGDIKIEKIMDSATGALLKSESYRVGSDENTRPGVTVRERDRDFVRVSQRGRDDDDDRKTSRAENDNESDSDRDSDDDSRDDDSDDDFGGHGGSDDSDDDHDGSDDRNDDSDDDNDDDDSDDDN